MLHLITSFPKLTLLISACLTSIFYILLHKAPKNTVILYFWIHIFAYLGFCLIYLFKDMTIHFDMTHLENIIFDTTYYNFPIYIFSGFCCVGTYIIFDLLIKSFSIPLVVSLSQISIIITTIGYIVLGDKTSIISILGIVTIFLGSIIAGCTSFSFKHPLKIFKSYNLNLLIWSTIKASLYSVTILISYLCLNKHNETTKIILHQLTKHLRYFPCHLIAPIHFNIGVQFSLFICILLFIIFYQKQSDQIIPTFFNYITLTLILSTLYVLHSYLLLSAYNYIPNQNMITAIMQLSLPITFFGSYIIYQTKNSKEELAGMFMIISGTMITVLG